MTTRWKLTIEYDGSGFYGWQKQAEGVTVQQVIEAAVHSFSGETVDVVASGRTDSGVHALAQVIHFDLEKEMDAHAVRGAMNFFVRPHRVSILQAEAVPCTFHARFSAKARAYRYLILHRAGPPSLMAGRVWHFPKHLDLAVMQEASQILLGTHDFTTFRAKFCQANSPIRTLDRMSIEKDGEMIVFEMQARSFLYHQVRNMVGTLSLVGSGRWSVDDFSQAFAAKDRAKGGPTAPPDGLYFERVVY